eukprot:gene15960-17566_t
MSNPPDRAPDSDNIRHDGKASARPALVIVNPTENKNDKVRCDIESTLLTAKNKVYKLCQTDDNVSVYHGLKRNYFKSFFFCLLVLATGGLAWLATNWKRKWATMLTMSRCPLNQATYIILEDLYGQVTVAKVCQLEISTDHELRKVLNLSKTFLDNEILVYNEHSLSYFEYRHQRYIWNANQDCFCLVAELDKLLRFNDLYKMSEGLSRKQELDKLLVYDTNMIDVLVLSYLKLFLDEAANPFYVFQLFSCILWFFDDYYYYAGTILVISLISIIISIYQTKKHLVNLRNMIAKSSMVNVLRPDGTEELMSSNDLVPGDVLVLPSNGCHLQCDAILLSGSVIINESMLTGESIPVTKTPLPNPPHNKPELNEVIDTVKHKRHILFCGTDLLQTRFHGKGRVIAVVIKTGYYTMKGNLIRSILFPKPVGFKFLSDALRFLGVLAIFAAMGFTYTVYVFRKQGSTVGEICLRAFDVITIAVPPALPAAMSVGTIYALQRLKKVNIYCTSPSRINISGKIKLFCFDKTGTLTEDGLDIFGTIVSENGIFQDVVEDVSDVELCEAVYCMSTCHSLTYIDGQLTGDPLDMKMFETTGWQLEEPSSIEETERYQCLVPTIVKPKRNLCTPNDHYETSLLDIDKMPVEIAILKQFTFSSELQRMSVIAQRLGKPTFDAYVKGSPEMISKLCIQESIPDDFDSVLRTYTEEGYRVIALASKSMDHGIKWHHMQHMVRGDVENHLTFRGFLILKNMVKKETKPMIDRLVTSSIRVVMVTGDNMLTAASVARECHMVRPSCKVIEVSATPSEIPGGIPSVEYKLIGQRHVQEAADSKIGSNFLDFRARDYHFAMNGKTFSLIRNHLPTLHERMMVCGTIFARMLPSQKAQLVEDLQSIGYTVGMCGDGANDCGALKAAHAGVSLSEAEASIASPFTSQIANISCVAEIIKEGRCALVTSFSLFKYMAMYSMVQYLSVLLLYSVRSNLGDFQYLYIDLLIIMPFAVTMSRTGPYETIVPRRPLGSLIHPLVLSSLILQILTQMTFQLGVFFFVKTRDYYKTTAWFHANTKHKEGHETQVISYENTVLFYVTSFQYIFLAVVLSLGKPYRDNMFKNFAFIGALLILLTFTFVLVLYPVGELKNIFQLVDLDDGNFTLSLLLWVGCNAVVSLAIEEFLVKSYRFRRLLNRIRNKKSHRNKYKLITIGFNLDETWPPL